MNEIETLKREMEELKDWKKSLEMSHSIPLNIDQSFRARFASSMGLTSSAKGATTENQAVNEGGAGVYNVLKPPDAFIQIIINSTLYYIPVYT